MTDKKLSVIISNRNDVSMLVVTIRSCIEELRPLGLENCEIVIVDNSDPQIYALISSALPTGYIKDGLLKVFRQDFPCIFTARELAAEKASGQYILCVDSHMLIGRDCFLDLVTFMDAHQDDPTLGFAHAPISWAHQHERHARHDRDMSVSELGNWGAAYKFPQTITWKGMPWICRRDWFLSREQGINGYGALSQHRLSWGGGDLHIGLKPWLLGYRNWAVPTRACIHIGPFPKIDIDDTNHNIVKADVIARDKYRVWAISGNGPHAIGFLVSCYILGGEPMMKRNESAITRRFGRFIDVRKEWKSAKEFGQEEKDWLDANKKLSFEQLLLTRPWDECPRNASHGCTPGSR